MKNALARPDWRTCVFILNRRVWTTTPGIESVVQDLFDAGLPSIQVRGEGLPPGEFSREYAHLRDRAARAGVAFFVHSDAAAAKLVQADGIHFPAWWPSPGNESGLPRTTRSAHDGRELDRCAAVTAALLSPIFATSSKPQAQPIGLEDFRRLSIRSPVPVIALGGVTLENVSACFEAGAIGVAGQSAFLESDGPRLVEEARSIAAKGAS